MPRNSAVLNRTAERAALAMDVLRTTGHLRLGVRGESMLPTLWPGDVVELESCLVDDVHPGEIVLAVRGSQFFLHRFVARSQPDGFLLCGDSMPEPDPQFPKEALVGRLVSVEARSFNQTQAQNRPVLPLRPWSRAMAKLLCYCGPARRLALTIHSRRNRNMQIERAEASNTAGTMDIGTA